MPNRYLLCLTLPLALAACGDDARNAVPDEAAPARLEVAEDAAPTAAEAPDAPLPRATVTDTLGSFEGQVFGLAVWEHQTLSFGGAVLAANGEAGLAVVPIDQEIEGGVVEGTFDGPVAVGYTEEASFAAAASGGEVLLFTVAPDRAFTRIGALASDADALCMIGDVLLAVSDEATAYRVTPAGTADPLFARPAPAGTSCAATDERFFLAAPGAPLRSFDVEGGDPLVDDGYTARQPRGFAALATPDGRALVYADDGALHVDGPATAHTSVRLLRERQTVTPDGPLATGSGNFGSIYRDGVVAMLTGPDLVLLPWAGIARAAGLEGVGSASLRPREPVTLPQPEIDLQLPQIETEPGPSED